MYFPSYLLAQTVLLLSHLSSMALGTPPNRRPAPVVDSNQVPLQVNGTAKELLFVACTSINTCLIDWMRAGLQPAPYYRVVEGNPEPFDRDHFFELQYIRDAIVGSTRTITLDDFYELSVHANSYDSVFQIANWVNNYKSKVPIGRWVTDNTLKYAYLCGEFEGGGRVWDAVLTSLNSMVNSRNAVVRNVGNYLTTELNPTGLNCP